MPNVIPGQATLTPLVEALSIDALAIVGTPNDPNVTGTGNCLATARGSATFAVNTDASGAPPNATGATMFGALYIASVGAGIGNAQPTADTVVQVAVGRSLVDAVFMGAGAGWVVTLSLEQGTEFDPNAAPIMDVQTVASDNLNNQFDVSESVFLEDTVMITTLTANCGVNSTISGSNPNTAIIWRGWVATGWYFVDDLDR
jgi:hypothetical protein